MAIRDLPSSIDDTLMRLFRLLATSAITLGLVFVFAADCGFAAPAKSPWQQEWENTLAVAKKEGQVTVYISGYEAVLPHFEKEFPEIKLTAVTARGNQLGQRLLSERRAEKYLADVVSSGANPNYQVFYLAKVLDPIKPALILPEVSDQNTFSHLAVLHGETNAGNQLVLVDRTSSHDFNTNTICGQVSSLSPFVIAQVHGAALAGGCGLATVCDVIFAADDSEFGYTETAIGFIPALVAVFLVRKIGEQHARELLLSARKISAEEVYSLGLVQYVVPCGSLEQAVLAYADQVSRNAPSAIALTKSLLAATQGMRN